MKEYYAEFRGEVKGARAGDRVKVWFSGEKRDRHWYRDRDVESEPFTYTVKSDTGAKVLVLANEDYTGFNPEEAPYNGAPRYLTAHVNAVKAAGYSVDVWDVDKQGVPHDLGVLDHYQAVVWYVGDNRYTQDEEDFLIDTGPGVVRRVPVHRGRRAPAVPHARRARLPQRGRQARSTRARWRRTTASSKALTEGLFYGLNGDPTAECVITTGVYGVFDDCLILANDFRQYWLGAFARVGLGGPNRFTGIASPITGLERPAERHADEPARLRGHVPAHQRSAAGGAVPAVPQPGRGGVRLHRRAVRRPPRGPTTPPACTRTTPTCGSTKTFDLRTISAADAPTLTAQLSTSTEDGYDDVIVEARTAGGSNWTTLPDPNGGTSNAVPAECEAGFLLEEHPALLAVPDAGAAACTNTGTSGAWNAFTGNSGGWQDVAFDLSAYAGQQVEITSRT